MSNEVKLKVRKRKKKERISPIEKELKLLIETGNVVFGLRKNIKEILLGNVKAVIYANKTRKDIIASIKKYADNITVIPFDGNSLDLGKLCGKPFPVSVIGVYDFGEADQEKIKSLVAK